MTDVLLSMLAYCSLGLALTLLLRRPLRVALGPGAAFGLWLMPPLLALVPMVPMVPHGLAPLPAVTLPAWHLRTPVGAAASGFDWGMLLAAIWLLGSAFGLARLLAQYLRFHRGMTPGSAAWRAAVGAMIPATDSAVIRQHPDGPAVLCALPRSLVLLPPDFPVSAAGAAGRLVLRHECTHARRGDAWWNLAMELVFALLWFHPLAWLARPRFRLDQELACDAAVLRKQPACAARYARALMESATAAHAQRVLIPWLRPPQLKERITMIARPQSTVTRHRLGILVVASLLLASFALGIASASSPAADPAPAVEGIDTAPKVVHLESPRYPEKALRSGAGGKVAVVMAVDASGKVTDVTIDPNATSAPQGMRQAAVASAYQWQFRPARRNGKAVAGTVRQVFSFGVDPPLEDPAAFVERLQHSPATQANCPDGGVWVPAAKACAHFRDTAKPGHVDTGGDASWPAAG